METDFEIDADAYFGKSLLQHIKWARTAEFLSTLKCLNPSRLTNSSGATLLHYAAKYGNVWLVKHLIDLGAKIDAQNNLKETPLLFAIRNNQLETIKTLLEAKADILIPASTGHCPLGQAFINAKSISEFHFANSTIVTVSTEIKLALKARVTRDSLYNSKHVKSKVFHDDCPLYEFITLKNPEITRILLKKGSPVDACEPKTRKTSLHIAIEELDIENVKVLVENKANVDGSLRFILNFSNQDKALAIFNILIAAGTSLTAYKNNTNLFDLLLLRGNREIVRSVLKYRINLHHRDHNLYTPLRCLARNRNPGVFAELRDYNFNVNTRTMPLNWTTLHHVVTCGNPSSIQFLLNRGADINAKCCNGHTPLSLIFTQNDPKERLEFYSECIEMLLANGADPRIKYGTDTRAYSNMLLGSTSFSKLFHPVLVHLSALEVSNQDIGLQLRALIQKIPKFKAIFDAKEIELEDIKNVKLGKSVTMLDFLLANNGKISEYARYRRLASTFFEDVQKYNLDPCYKRKLHQSFMKFINSVELRKSAAITINKIFGKMCNISVYDVAEKIVGYLEDHELQKFLSAKI